jgi:hypothetical protein
MTELIHKVLKVEKSQITIDERVRIYFILSALRKIPSGNQLLFILSSFQNLIIKFAAILSRF